MKYRIAHYYGKSPPVPEAVEIEANPLFDDSPEAIKRWGFEVEIDDLPAFVEKHGNIILSPPDRSPCRGDWFIWVTDPDGKFQQR